MRLFAGLILLALALGGTGWFVTAPERLPRDAFAGVTGDPGRGAAVFWAGGCAGCHAAAGATGEARLVLAGGQRFSTAFGTFVAPNISPHPEAGIGAWSLEDFGDAMQRGVAPDGSHYYPAFPYTAYRRATAQDIADLWAFLRSLPPDATPSAPHDIRFPFSIRRGIGLWKLLFWSDAWVVAGPLSGAAARGRYLAEALGHCGECHTPRGRFGQLDTARWLAGAPNPAGPGRVPNITPARLTWSEAEIAAYLETGFTPDFDVAGGHMAAVIRSLAELPPEDRAALAAYLKSVPPVD
jgi:mono/diheme cytochrome c family protein